MKKIITLIQILQKMKRNEFKNIIVRSSFVLIGETGGHGINVSPDGGAVLIDNTAYDKNIGESGDSAPLLNSAIQTVAN
jgi:hypothetical protein